MSYKDPYFVIPSLPVEPLPPVEATYRDISPDMIQFDWMPPPEGDIDNYLLIYQENDNPTMKEQVIRIYVSF